MKKKRLNVTIMLQKENIKEHNPNWPQIPDHPCRILTTGDLCSGRTISLFNLISQQPDTKTICFYNLFKDPCEAKFKLEKYNPNKKRKILTVFDDIIADMLTNKKLNLVLTELFIRGRKLNISLIFIMQSYFSLPKILD